VKTSGRIAFAFLLSISPVEVDAANAHYPSAAAPLQAAALVPLPLGSVKPSGWLRDQLVIQANGLTGHLDEFWTDLGPQSAWLGGSGEGWERGPYYLDGLLPLAYLLDDARLIAKTRPWVEWMLKSGQPNGWFGPAKNKDRWPLAVALKVLAQYHDATGDRRALDLIGSYIRFLASNPPDWPDREWRGVRAGENVVTAYWYYNRTRSPEAIQAASSILENSFDWAGYFLAFPFPREVIEKGVKHGHLTHVVNIAMAVKYPALRFALTGDEKHKRAVYEGFRSLDLHHGQVGGRFAGDEHLAGPRPTQGTEFCGIVELMFSLENVLGVTGDPVFADRLEMLAYNGQPGTCTPDMWGHQYDQQANQVLVSVAKRRWSTNGDTSNIYGVEPNFGCCTSNFHQGWPKFVAHLWMATPDNGLAAVAYGPSTVKARVGAAGSDATEVTIVEGTDYPFDGAVRLSVQIAKAASFPLLLRIPSWAAGATVSVGGTSVEAKAGGFHRIERSWKDGDTVSMNLPMKLRTEERFNGAAAILRGPLVFSLKLGELYRQIPKAEKGTFRFSQYPHADWEIHPASPWNYGLVLDREAPERSIEVVRAPVSAIPFAQSTAPVVLKTKGRRILSWVLEDNSAGETPRSPAETSQEIETVELIPYGSTRLRISEFPTVK